MFDNTEKQDLEMVGAVAEAIQEEIDRQVRTHSGTVDMVALVAIVAMVRWARTRSNHANSHERTGR